MRLAIIAVLMLGGCDLWFELHGPPASTPDAPTSMSFLEGYSARKPIDINLMTMAPLVDFPFMVHFVADPDLANLGDDHFAFTDASGVTELDFEIESYDPVTGDLIAWVRIPTGFDNNRLFVYYDGPAVLRDTRPTWSPAYDGVWHMAGLEDSTGRNALSPGPLPPTDSADCRVGRCREFSQADGLGVDPVQTGTLSFGSGSFSYSVWVFAAPTSNDGSAPITRGSTDDGGYGMYLGAGEWVAEVSAGFRVAGSTAVADSQFSSAPIIGRWVHLVAVIDRDLHQLRTYVDGEMTDLGVLDKVGSIDPDPPDLAISRGGPGNSEAFIGKIDEVRVYSTALSETQIQLEFKNLTDPSLVTIGLEETR